MTFLSIDIGNSHTVLGIFREDTLLGEWRLSTFPLLKPNALDAHLRLFCSEVGLRPMMIDAAGIASVVPKSTSGFVKALRRKFSIEPMIVSGNLPTGMRLRYTTSTTLGADRICNAVAAYARYGGPVIIVDLGTATTFDIVSKNGTYLGGIIFPGIATLANALHYFTAQLPIPPLEFPRSAIGKNTLACLQAGIMFGTLDAMDGLIRRLKKEVGVKAWVVATGGFAPLIAPRTASINEINSSLVLEGIRLIHKKIMRSDTRRKRGR
jgi:type III pantothenate kinase